MHVAKHLRDRKLQRALMQFFKPENYFEVRQALLKAGRRDLIGSGCDALIPAQPPAEALAARRHRAQAAVERPNSSPPRQRQAGSVGYRPPDGAGAKRRRRLARSGRRLFAS